MNDMVCKQSTVTARDYVEAVSDVLGIEPKPENADRIQTAIEKRGGFVDPKWLLNILIEMKKTEVKKDVV